VPATPDALDSASGGSSWLSLCVGKGFLAAAPVGVEMDVDRTWAPGSGVGQSLHLDTHPVYSCFSELMAKLEKHKGEEEEEEEQEHSDHREDPQ